MNIPNVFSNVFRYLAGVKEQLKKQIQLHFTKIVFTYDQVFITTQHWLLEGHLQSSYIITRF